MGAVRSDINRMRRVPEAKKLIKKAENKPGTIPDGRSGDHYFEDKFGQHARLSAGQKIAQREWKDPYTVYHFLPEHVGKVLSMPLMGLAPQLAIPRPSNRSAPKPRPR